MLADTIHCCLGCHSNVIEAETFCRTCRDRRLKPSTVKLSGPNALSPSQTFEGFTAQTLEPRIHVDEFGLPVEKPTPLSPEAVLSEKWWHWLFPDPWFAYKMQRDEKHRNAKIKIVDLAACNLTSLSVSEWPSALAANPLTFSVRNGLIFAEGRNHNSPSVAVHGEYRALSPRETKKNHFIIWALKTKQKLAQYHKASPMRLEEKELLAPPARSAERFFKGLSAGELAGWGPTIHCSYCASPQASGREYHRNVNLWPWPETAPISLPRKFEPEPLIGTNTFLTFMQNAKEKFLWKNVTTASLQKSGKAWKIVNSYRVEGKAHPVATKLHIGVIDTIDESRKRTLDSEEWQNYIKAEALRHCISQAKAAFKERDYEAWVTWNVKVTALLMVGAKLKKPNTGRFYSIKDAAKGWSAIFVSGSDVLAKFSRFAQDDMDKLSVEMNDEETVAQEMNPIDSVDPELDLTTEHGLLTKCVQEAIDASRMYDSEEEPEEVD